MHAMMLVMVLTVGSEPEMVNLPSGNYVSPGNSIAAENPGGFPGAPGPYHYEPPRDPHENAGLICGFFKYCGAWFRPMPQTCYTPHYGCYPGNGRDIHRYPAFHGYYYRQAYNYRPLFEYPWQAGMHEPLPLEISSARSLAGKTSESEAGPEVIEKPASPSRSNP